MARPTEATAMRLAPPFTDHAVLQRDQPIPVWGQAGPAEEVTVRFAGQLARTVASPDGAWLVRLPPLPAGGPHQLVASAASGEARIDDVLVGEVWICSGQSNMQWTLANTTQLGKPEDNTVPGVRLLSVSTPARLGRQSEVGGSWQLATHATLATFSAVGSWFGRELRRELDVPIGLICNAWGGTRVQTWISRDALVQDPTGADEVRHYEGYVFAPDRIGKNEFGSQAEWEQSLRGLDTGNAGLARGWASATFADQGWRTMRLPSPWQDHGHPGSGVFWFRRAVAVPAAWAGRDLELHLGAIDKHDDTWVNGERVGGLSWEQGGETWCTPRVYPVPGRLVGKDGMVTIAVRARSHAFHGGMIGPVTEMRVHPVGDPAGAVELSGAWRYDIEQDWGVQTPPATMWGRGNANSPYCLFDSRIAPLLPYGIRGAIWYQGESNASEAAVYRRMLPLMIRDWRRAWGQGNFPFLQVQLANYTIPADGTGRSDWAELRDAQTAALAEPATGMAVAIDVGDAGDIHPRDKKTVGLRLARWALAETYGRGGTPSGPLFAGMTVEAGGRVRCRFRHATGLRTRGGGAPSHVAIAGIDRQFVLAQAVIEGETLVAWHPKVPRPAAVRYAWANNPAGCNLANGDDLPASPFRSDAW
jgi:sialate O-acetylesterase